MLPISVDRAPRRGAHRRFKGWHVGHCWVALKLHGGMKVYAGPPAAARAYLEADRGRADDYYLAEGTGLARRFTARAGRVAERAHLTGDRYEAWVAGHDPDTGLPRGQLRGDARAVRFVEVVVNGPKSWSLAAALHEDVAAAYDAAQDRAAAQIIGWLAAHATTRVGPRGGQVQVPVEVLEAVTVRHYTSRAGDPHRHLHVQIGARVFAAGKWRGLHTVGVRDFLAAINGIGHAAVACDPAIPGSTGRARLHLRRVWRNTGARRVRRSVQCAGGADRTQFGPLRTRLDDRAPRRTARSGAAAGMGCPGVGRRPPGQGHPPLGRRPDRAVAGRTGRAGLPRPRHPGRAAPRPGRSAGSRPRRRPHADPAGRRPLGVERR